MRNMDPMSIALLIMAADFLIAMVLTWAICSAAKVKNDFDKIVFLYCYILVGIISIIIRKGYLWVVIGA
jgi:hypothetical protein